MAKIVVKGIGISDSSAIEYARKIKPGCIECGSKPERVLIMAVGIADPAGQIPVIPIGACGAHTAKLRGFEEQAAEELKKRIKC